MYPLHGKGSSKLMLNKTAHFITYGEVRRLTFQDNTHRFRASASIIVIIIMLHLGTHLTGCVKERAKVTEASSSSPLQSYQRSI